MFDRGLYLEFVGRMNIRRLNLFTESKRVEDVERANRVFNHLLPFFIFPDDIETPKLFVSEDYAAGSVDTAFSSDDGLVVIFEDALGSDGQLAVVLAHELAHVQNQDVFKITKRFLDSGYYQVSQSLQDDSGFISLFSRDDFTLHKLAEGIPSEIDADNLAVTVALAAGYKPEEMMGAAILLNDELRAAAMANRISKYIK